MREDPPVGSGAWPPPVPGPQVTNPAPPPPPAPVVPPAPFATPAPVTAPPLISPPAAPASPGRGRRRLLLVGLAVVVVSAAGAGIGLALGGSGSATGAGAARRLLSASLAGARAAGSFHYVSVFSSSSARGRATQVTVGDAAATQGRQDITVNGDRFSVLVIGSTSYFQGDALAMVSSLGVPAPVAEAHARQWISLVSGDAPYQSVTAAVTTSSALDDNVTFRPTDVLGVSKVAGRQVQAVRGPVRSVGGQQVKGTATLYMTTGSRPVPVRYVERGTLGKGSSAGSLDFTLTFSAWGAAVTVTAPPAPVPFSALGASGTPSGPGPTYYT